jgi:glycosyltransferase involved in cell wall biosynthesis
MNLYVVIPALNEEAYVGEIVSGICRLGLDVVVIDDGSRDSTGETARQNGAHVIRHAIRQGKGASLRDGFQHALTQGCDAVVTMDGDGQHAVSDLPAFIEKFENEPGYGVINGSRMLSCRSMPKVRLYTNRLMSALISWLCRQRIADTQCGFRLIRADVLRKVTLRSAGFQIESELLIEAARAGFTIGSVPIQTIYSDEKSSINPVVDTFRFIGFFINQLFR